jgi:hypothetical protein
MRENNSGAVEEFLYLYKEELRVTREHLREIRSSNKRHHTEKQFKDSNNSGRIVSITSLIDSKSSHLYSSKNQPLTGREISFDIIDSAEENSDSKE